MLQITEATRDQITAFLGGLSVPVRDAGNFQVVIQALNNLMSVPEGKPEPETDTTTSPTQ
jgi:hypothetical protein